MDESEPRLEKLEPGEQPRDWNHYKIIWKLGNFSLILIMLNFLKKRKTKMILTQTRHATFVAQLFSANLMATVPSSAPSLMVVAQYLSNQCLSLYL